MSQSPTASAALRYRRAATDEPRTVGSEDGMQALLDVLHDPDCRAILDATSDEALSASELSEACGLPLSTTYRKVDMLTDAGVLSERTRIRRSGKHASEYVRLVEDVVFSVAADGEMEARVSSRQVGRTEPDA